MKKIQIVLIGFLLILSLPLLCEAQTKVKASPKYAASDLIQITVAKGDYLVNVCKQYLDSEKRWPEIARINRLKDANRIKPGMRIAVPIAYMQGTPLEGKVTFVQGNATAQLGSQGPWVSLKPGDSVPPKSNLKTEAESALEITFEDGSSFLLRAETRMGILQAQKYPPFHLVRDLYLGAGRVLTTVRTATGEAPRFKVRTPAAIASVRGTEFRVAVDESQKTYAEVLKHLVTVAAADRRVDLSSGEGTVVTKGEPPLPPRKLLPPPAPVGLQAIFNTAPALRFSAVEGASAYRIMAVKDREGKHVLKEKIVKPDDTLNITGLPDGAYHLLTQSIDAIGLEGPPSEAYPLVIRVNPIPPMTQTPQDGAKLKGAVPEFQWLAVSDADRYHMQIAEDRDFRTVVLDRAEVKGSTFRPDGPLPYKPHFFRIRSVARDNYQGAWSDPLSFFLFPLPPVPSVDQPAVSKEEIRLKSRNLGEGFRYHFQIARDRQFQQLLVDTKTEKPEITIKRPKEAGTYHVRIGAIDRDGDTGGFSAPQSFEVPKGFPYEWLGGSLEALLLIWLLVL
ncbi:MAG: FecR protein [Syntrophaceae bacterium PtaU1.Bin231]|nr:MAG: FecR protein [Syntrophaceae bacterium PtaU1.Bin231]